MAASNPTELPDGVPEDAVDALYGLPLEEFTPGRDALAKELRSGDQRDAAAWVKGLKKPSAAAWLVNQLARTQKKDAKRVLDGAEALRTAQDRTVAGKGSAQDLSRAAQEHADAVEALLAKAPGLLDGQGRAPSTATLERAADTLRAIPLDEDVRTSFASGRLTREGHAAGFGFMPGAEAAEATPKSRPTRDRGDAAKEKAAARTAVTEAKARQRAGRKETTDLERALGQAERDAESAKRRLDDAAAALERAREKEAGLKDQVDEAEAAVKRLK